MKVLRPEMKEYQAEAVEAVFKMNGAEYPGYPSIVEQQKPMYNALYHKPKNDEGKHLLK